MNLNINGQATEALPYTFPKKGRARVKINIDGVETEAVITGGGKWPEYTYFKLNGDSMYVKGALAEGTILTLTKPEPAQPKTEPVKEPVRKPSKRKAA